MNILEEIRRIGRTATWSWLGWRAAWASEKSLRQWTLVNVLSVIAAFALPLTLGERALILSLGLVLLASELLNTAIEEIVDVILPNQDPRAAKAKDCGSAAVALTALAGGVAWIVILVRVFG